ncbi:hypothetical protein K2173_026321 [Erythroxylum novogranatense]|uniref:Uncharacterized protein n=1 Tax=Erythroxylum novogranatense TaxID=1862640 RepID=A0AAV8SBZ9_9ROSI|nr:hypothetical protein K2173_026321 [Erythroxylum novogranatense]
MGENQPMMVADDMMAPKLGNRSEDNGNPETGNEQAKASEKHESSRQQQRQLTSLNLVPIDHSPENTPESCIHNESMNEIPD